MCPTNNRVILNQLKRGPVAKPSGCGCGGKGHGHEHGHGHGHGHGEEGHGHPPIPQPGERLLTQAGEPLLRALIIRLHQNLRASEIGHMFPDDDDVFLKIVNRIADYFVEACGGEAAYSTAGGDACMGSVHRHLPVDGRGRELWLTSLWRAFDDVGYPPDLREEFWNWVEPFTLTVINRPGPAAPRIPFAVMAAAAEPRLTSTPER